MVIHTCAPFNLFIEFAGFLTSALQPQSRAKGKLNGLSGKLNGLSSCFWKSESNSSLQLVFDSSLASNTSEISSRKKIPLPFTLIDVNKISPFIKCDILCKYTIQLRHQRISKWLQKLSCP